MRAALDEGEGWGVAAGEWSPDLIIVDDLCTEGEPTEEQRKRLTEWLSRTDSDEREETYRRVIDRRKEESTREYRHLPFGFVRPHL